MCLSLDCASVYVIVFRLCVSVCDCLLTVCQCMCLSLDCASVYVIVFRLCVSVRQSHTLTHKLKTNTYTDAQSKDNHIH